ncbi:MULTISPECIES: hypothetical protein [Bacillales]|uniref:hypothetical protein n=1 Tax=Bacillales TaxID=1385 RepID=UPI000345A5B7|nr:MULTISPECIES: hypothetical protein [Bacillales]
MEERKDVTDIFVSLAQLAWFVPMLVDLSGGEKRTTTATSIYTSLWREKMILPVKIVCLKGI